MNEGHRGVPGGTRYEGSVGVFERTRWLAVLLPAVFVGAFEFLRHQWLNHALPEWLGSGWPGNVVGATVTAAVVYGFVRFFSDVLQNLASQAARSREEAAVIVERQRIAREMHDGVAQALFYSITKLRGTDELVAAGEGDRARDELRVVEGHMKEAYRQVKTVVSDLKRQDELEDFGEAVRRTVDDVAARSGMQVRCEVVGNHRIPASSRRHLLAIIQEALTNASRHGRTRRAAVQVTSARDITVQVSDDGAGFDPGKPPREDCYGLAIMEERAQTLGGQLSLESSPGRGTRVTVRAPGDPG